MKTKKCNKVEKYLNNSIICNTFFSKLRGLMFRSRNFKTPLLFVFNKPGIYPIHSFFCSQKFVAIWLIRDKIVDVKIVKPWSLIIKPKHNFDTLIEIPFRSEREINRFLDGIKKSL